VIFSYNYDQNFFENFLIYRLGGSIFFLKMSQTIYFFGYMIEGKRKAKEKKK